MNSVTHTNFYTTIEQHRFEHMIKVFTANVNRSCNFISNMLYEFIRNFTAFPCANNMIILPMVYALQHKGPF